MIPRVASSDESHGILDYLDADSAVPTGIVVACVLKGTVDLVAIHGSLVANWGPIGWLTIGVAVVDLYVVYGLLTLEPWGWTWAVVLGAVGVVLELWPPDAVILLVATLTLVTVYVYSKRPVYESAAT